ncbi:MAG: beta-N-acetylhexosaminidase [Candidatus Sumerlaeota bacterium]
MTIRTIAKQITSLMAAAAFVILFSAASADEQAHGVAVIPQPLMLEYGNGEFAVEPGLKIYAPDKSPIVQAAAKLLAEKIADTTGSQVLIKGASPKRPFRNSIQLLLTGTDPALADEGYTISVTTDCIIARAAEPAGLLYAAETIRQLFPAGLESKSRVQNIELKIPALTIIDKPRFSWRSTMLDCSRNFMSKEFIFHYLDILAYYKMNVFHWHLTDDQGWRIEIKKYPRLTEFGAWRGEGENRTGGFYTQEDVKEIVAYAKKLNIRVVPEIEMPGHSTAAIASYPYLSCTGEQIPVRTTSGIEKTIMCAGKESTFEFEENVLAEVAAIFPDQYVHIGGDEAPKDRWKECPLCQARIKSEGLKDEKELQSYFIKRIEKILAKHGKKMIGWDEIYEGGLSPTAVLQYWNHDDNFRGAIANGNYVITSPTRFTYLDYPEIYNPETPKFMKILPVSKVYSFDPIIEGVEPWQEHLVLGGDAPLWTERVPEAKVEYKLLPRLAAFSEVLWSRRGPRDYNEFLKRLDANYSRLDAMGIQYSTFEKDTRGQEAEPAAATPMPKP